MDLDKPASWEQMDTISKSDGRSAPREWACRLKRWTERGDIDAQAAKEVTLLLAAVLLPCFVLATIADGWAGAAGVGAVAVLTIGTVWGSSTLVRWWESLSCDSD